MRVQNTVTFIISKNYGRPLSVSVPVWGVYAGGTALVLLLALLVAMSALYLLTYQRVRQMEHETEQLRRQRDALREQVLSANQEAYEARERAFLVRGREPGETPEPEHEDYTLHFGDELYEPPIRVTAYSVRVTRRTVEVSFRLKNQGDPSNNRGGFLFAIFENDEAAPTEYEATPTVKTNPEGFPEAYKMGIRFTRIRDAVTFRRKLRRHSDDEFYTHVTLYLFSVRGGLLLRERFELERDLFFKEQPVVRTQQITSA